MSTTSTDTKVQQLVFLLLNMHQKSAVFVAAIIFPSTVMGFEPRTFVPRTPCSQTKDDSTPCYISQRCKPREI